MKEIHTESEEDEDSDDDDFDDIIGFPFENVTPWAFIVVKTSNNGEKDYLCGK